MVKISFAINKFIALFGLRLKFLHGLPPSNQTLVAHVPLAVHEEKTACQQKTNL
jgi:hypothetical protein